MAIDPLGCAWFLLIAFVLAGVAQTMWFRHPVSRAFAIPIDGGRTIGGRRVFGDNKTWRGFVVMVPAAACAFWVLSLVTGAARGGTGLWPLTAVQYALLGAWAGAGFMAGELPNSFLKRRLGIAPGEPAGSMRSTLLHFLLDRIDSGIGMLGALALVVPVAWQTWAAVLLVGPAIHWSFSLLMFRLGVKARAA